jgi:hypothetical protein
LPTQVLTESTTRVFSAPSQEYRDKFNRTSFHFSHNLSGNELFELPRLAALANKLLAERGPASVRWQISDVPVDKKWADVPLNKQQEKVAEAISHMNESGSWVLLYSVQNDPAYAALLDRVFGELEGVTGVSLAGKVTWKDAYIFIASPGSVTPYHIDHEATFLFQVHGRRVANIWDPNDRTNLTDREIEEYYIGDLGAANYRHENQQRAKVYDLVAGTGVHHPMLAPHWFKNGGEYSVALGVHFCLRDADQTARVYQVNHYLRRMGFQPSAPGESASKDAIKKFAVGLFSKRNPKNKFELLRSGIRRMVAPLDWAKKLKA